jgi:hypothetical protein
MEIKEAPVSMLGRPGWFLAQHGFCVKHTFLLHNSSEERMEHLKKGVIFRSMRCMFLEKMMKNITKVIFM